MLLLVLMVATLSAQERGDDSIAVKKPRKNKCVLVAKPFSFKFYGRIRGDLSYNTRNSQESVDGLFYMYPLNVKYDPNGNDINATAAGNFYMIYTRLGVDISGPTIGKASVKANVEIDFRGSGTTFALPRIRHAFVEFRWPHNKATDSQNHSTSGFLVGQTWHPMYGEVAPTMLNLSTGAPFQPFNRSPQIRYQYLSANGFQLTAAALWQLQYNSAGADGKTYKYLKNSCVPELFVGFDYKHNGWTAGVGCEMLSITPRLTAKGADDMEYKVKERITTFSAEAHVKYVAKEWNIMAKGVYGSNLAHCSMLGGYGVSAKDEITGAQQYTPYRHVSAWLNVVYGKKWQPVLFVGYSKNLGTAKTLLMQDGKTTTYGTGLDIDQLLSANATLTYNLPHWKIGAEFEPSIAWYKSNAVVNYRILGVVMFIF